MLAHGSDLFFLIAEFHDFANGLDVIERQRVTHAIPDVATLAGLRRGQVLGLQLGVYLA